MGAAIAGRQFNRVRSFQGDRWRRYRRGVYAYRLFILPKLHLPASAANWLAFTNWPSSLVSLIIYFVNYGIAGLGSQQWKIDTGWRYMIASGLIPSSSFPGFTIHRSGKSALAHQKQPRRGGNGHPAKAKRGTLAATAIARDIHLTLNAEEGTC